MVHTFTSGGADLRQDAAALGDAPRQRCTPPWPNRPGRPLKKFFNPEKKATEPTAGIFALKMGSRGTIAGVIAALKADIAAKD
jgi:hypothetical protein